MKHGDRHYRDNDDASTQRRRRVARCAIALGAAFALQLPAGAQRGGGAGPVRFPTSAQFEASAEAQKHVGAARKIAGADLVKEFENTCSATGPQRVALAREAAGQPPLKDYTVEPTRVFDNMWYVGLASQGAFVITTSEGIILIDTLNNTEEARDVIVPGIKKAGLNPAQIKYIVMTHGHPGQTNHTGGANYLQRNYRPRVMMSKEDTHPGIYQDTLADMEAIRKNANAPNPFLYGRDRAARYWTMMLECAEARVIALEEAAKRRS